MTPLTLYIGRPRFPSEVARLAAVAQMTSKSPSGMCGCLCCGDVAFAVCTVGWPGCGLTRCLSQASPPSIFRSLPLPSASGAVVRFCSALRRQREAETVRKKERPACRTFYGCGIFLGTGTEVSWPDDGDWFVVRFLVNNCRVEFMFRKKTNPFLCCCCFLYVRFHGAVSSISPLGEAEKGEKQPI